jgi:phage shock protein C
MSEKGAQEQSKTKRAKLYRSKKDRMVAGVCGGVSSYWGIDTVLLRIIWVLSILFGGVGFLLYLAAIIIIPENPDESYQEEDTSDRDNRTAFWGSLLIIVGSIILLKQFGFFYYIRYWDIPWKVIWSILLILLGVFLLVNKRDSEAGNALKDGEIEAKPSRKQLFRSRSQKMISGVCGGLANYFDIDVSIVRVGWVLLTLVSFGAGIVGYIVMVIAIQEDPEEVSSSSETVLRQKEK